MVAALKYQRCSGRNCGHWLRRKRAGRESQRWHGEHEHAAGFEQAMRLDEQGAGIADVLDDIGKDANIIAVAGDGKIVGVGLKNSGDVADDLAGQRHKRAAENSMAGGIKAPGGRAHEEIAASAADFQHSGAGLNAVFGDQVEETVGSGPLKLGNVLLTHVAPLNRENLGAMQTREFGVFRLRAGSHQATVMAAHDAEAFHGELVEEARPVADGARGEGAAGDGGRGGVSVGHCHGEKPLLCQEVIP